MLYLLYQFDQTLPLCHRHIVVTGIKESTYAKVHDPALAALPHLLSYMHPLMLLHIDPTGNPYDYANISLKYSIQFMS